MKAITLGFLMLAAAPASQADDKWDAADAAVARIAPSKFPGLPKQIAKELNRRKCSVPQTHISTQPHNAITGSFRSTGAKDWAVLCSKERVTSVLIFWGGSASQVAEMLASPDRNWLQAVGENRIGFSRYISKVNPQRMLEYQSRGNDAQPLSFSHDGIEESFLEKASTIRYFAQGKWNQLLGAD